MMKHLKYWTKERGGIIEIKKKVREKSNKKIPLKNVLPYAIRTAYGLVSYNKFKNVKQGTTAEVLLLKCLQKWVFVVFKFKTKFTLVELLMKTNTNERTLQSVEFKRK